jgi:hypothetical protein
MEYVRRKLARSALFYLQHVESRGWLFGFGALGGPLLFECLTGLLAHGLSRRFVRHHCPFVWGLDGPGS